MISLVQVEVWNVEFWHRYIRLTGRRFRDIRDLVRLTNLNMTNPSRRNRSNDPTMLAKGDKSKEEVCLAVVAINFAANFSGPRAEVEAVFGWNAFQVVEMRRSGCGRR